MTKQLERGMLMRVVPYGPGSRSVPVWTMLGPEQYDYLGELMADECVVYLRCDKEVTDVLQFKMCHVYCAEYGVVVMSEDELRPCISSRGHGRV